MKSFAILTLCLTLSSCPTPREGSRKPSRPDARPAAKREPNPPAQKEERPRKLYSAPSAGGAGHSFAALRSEGGRPRRGFAIRRGWG